MPNHAVVHLDGHIDDERHPRLIKAIEEQLKAFSHVCYLAQIDRVIPHLGDLARWAETLTAVISCASGSTC